MAFVSFTVHNLDISCKGNAQHVDISPRKSHMGVSRSFSFCIVSWECPFMIRDQWVERLQIGFCAFIFYNEMVSNSYTTWLKLCIKSPSCAISDSFVLVQSPRAHLSLHGLYKFCIMHWARASLKKFRHSRHQSPRIHSLHRIHTSVRQWMSWIAQMSVSTHKTGHIHASPSEPRVVRCVQCLTRSRHSIQ